MAIFAPYLCGVQSDHTNQGRLYTAQQRLIHNFGFWFIGSVVRGQADRTFFVNLFSNAIY